LKRIVSENRRTAAAKVAADHSIHLEDRFHKNSLTRELNKSNIRGRTAVAQPPITESKAGQLAKKDGVMIIKPDVS